MIKGSLSPIENQLQERLSKILDRGKSSQGAAARIFPLYQRLQTRRFETQNASEGSPWPSLNPKYAAYKLKRYGGGAKGRGKEKEGVWQSWPGAGRKTLIGTSTLAGAVIGRGSSFEGVDKNRQIYKPYSLQITVDTSGTNAEGKPFNYPQFVAKTRPFMEFSAASKEQMKTVMKSYLIGSE